MDDFSVISTASAHPNESPVFTTGDGSFQHRLNQPRSRRDSSGQRLVLSIGCRENCKAPRFKWRVIMSQGRTIDFH
jgi:hypothetical protein